MKLDYLICARISLFRYFWSWLLKIIWFCVQLLKTNKKEKQLFWDNVFKNLKCSYALDLKLFACTICIFSRFHWFRQCLPFSLTKGPQTLNQRVWSQLDPKPTSFSRTSRSTYMIITPTRDVRRSRARTHPSAISSRLHRSEKSIGEFQIGARASQGRGTNPVNALAGAR